MGAPISIYISNKIKYFEILGWTGQAILFSRIDIKNIKDDNENYNIKDKAGIYFLFGTNENGEDAVYIGETENIYKRIKFHDKNETIDFSKVLLFTSKDTHLTKAHARYLEYRLIEKAKEAKRYIILNDNNPSNKKLPLGHDEYINDYIDKMKILMNAISLNVLEPLISIDTNKSIEFIIEKKGILARATYTEEGFVVKKDSQAIIKESDKLSNSYKKKRSLLINDEVLKERGSKYIFTKDYLFSSASQAASVILGYSESGLRVWHLLYGKRSISLKEYLEKEQHDKL